jgi:hypothetical protein
MRLAEEAGIIPLFEAIDLAAGADSDSFQMKSSDVDIILITGVLTVPGALSVFSGATAAAKTTALPFTYRLSGADFKATGADLFGAEIAEADGVLTLSATTHDHRTFVIHIDTADLPEGHSWVTLNLASGTAQAVAAVAIMRGPRYQPALTAI